MTPPDEIQTLVMQWKETSALLNKRDAVIGVCQKFSSRSTTHLTYYLRTQDLLRIVETRTLAASPPDQGHQQLSHECSDLRRKLRELEKRHTAIQSIFVSRN